MPGPERVHEIRAHWLPGCPPPADRGDPELDLTALGDFDPSAETREVLRASEGPRPLVVPPDTRAVVLEATTRLGRYTGLGAPGADGSVDVALWPAATGCDLVGDEADALTPPGGEAFGVTRDGRHLLVAGGVAPGRAASAVAVDLATGVTVKVPVESGPRAFRAGARVTAFGDGLLVSGGEDPTDAAAPLGTAEVYRPDAGGFEAELVPLERPRARHAAVELLGGETLLVGGVSDAGRALSTLEVVSPASRRYRVSGLASLGAGRVDPVALRLTDGRVLVAGGTTAPEAGAPGAETLEWLSADASALVATSTALVTEGGVIEGRAFAAMPGGGVLVAGGCHVGTAPPACPAPCGGGRGCASRDVRWITAEGRADSLPDALDSGIAEPRLVAGPGGRPILLGVGDDGARRTLVFDPWDARFTPADVGVDPGASPAVLAADAGLFVWLGAAGGRPSLGGLRHGTRGEFVQPVAPLLLGGTTGVSLDRAPGPDAGLAADGGVELRAPGSALVVTDATFADLSIELSVPAGGPLPLVSLGARTYGDARCPWPAATGPDGRAFVRRVGRDVMLGAASATRTCPGPDGRAGIVVSAADASVRLRSIALSRSP